MTLSGTSTVVHDVVAGLGGRPVTRDLVHRLLTQACARLLPDDELTFADLDVALAAREVHAELERERLDLERRAETSPDPSKEAAR